MSDPDGVWEQDGVLRWERWLEAQLSRFRVDRLNQSISYTSDEAVWTVLIREGKPGRIHVTREALALSREGFAEVISALERRDWFADLDQALRIRIDESSRISRV